MICRPFKKKQLKLLTLQKKALNLSKEKTARNSEQADVGLEIKLSLMISSLIKISEEAEEAKIIKAHDAFFFSPGKR